MRHVALTLGCSVVLVSGLAVAQQHNMPSGKMTDEEIIKSAMSAAPETIGKGATIIDVSSDGKIRVVRQGSNQFTCMADNPNTPGPDPMCGDRNAMEWIEAWLNKKEPPKNKVGFMYMLAGGTDASNTDPYAQKPEANNNWVETGPARHDRWREGTTRCVPEKPEAGHVGAVCHVARYALRACDDPGAVAGAMRACLDRVRLAGNDALLAQPGLQMTC